MIGFIRRIVTMRVATRLFLLFVLCAFVPLAAIAVLSFSQVQSLLLKQGEQRLGAAAKAYGMTLFERLQLASEVGAGLAEPMDHGKTGTVVQRIFSRVGVVGADGRWRSGAGDGTRPQIPSDARSRIAKGRPAVIVDTTGTNAILLGFPLSGSPGAFAVGEVRPEFLWGSPDELPTVIDVCVIEDGSHRVLHCPDASMRAPAARAIDSQTASALLSTGWESEGQRFRARVWPHFMREGFGTLDWIVVAAQSESYQLAPVKKFAALFVPIVVLALLLVAWLTARQSLDIVAPLEKLAVHARGIAVNNFESRLELRRDDEFGEVAVAFNQMSQRLGNQFDSLSAFSEIDRLILGAQDIEAIVRTVLLRLCNSIPAQVVSITLLNQDSADQARTFFVLPAAPQALSLERHAATVGDRALLDPDSRGSWLDVDGSRAVPFFLAHAEPYGVRAAYLQPIAWGGAVCGVLSLAYRDAARLTEEESQEARDLADRVAVAVASAWRDEQLYQQAHFDTLTGLPNRLLFKDRLEREIARSQREGATFALLFIDLDHFKHVNDSFGHSEGDKVLGESARRIAKCLRHSDTVARLSGDEFTVMLSRLHGPQEAWLLAETIIAALSQEFNLGEQRCFLSASIGIASFPADGASAEELLKSADTAMYRAKAAGRAQAIFFEEKMNREAVARVTLDRDLRAAIDRNELVLHYQPQIDVVTGRISGAEALIRWNHPKQGLVSPLRFIPLAEESGFIEQIGRWTIERACGQMKEWRAKGLDLSRVSVNVSPRQFRRPGLGDFIRATVESSGLPAECLEFEITEGLLLERGEAVEGLLLELDQSGHRIALDDFGTGFSSMSYLQRFPVHTIKIDRVFIEGIDRTSDSQAIVAAIIAMSHALGKTVIAEGVETAGQLALLTKLRCDEIQGFLISRALPPAEFERFFVERAVPAIS